MIEAVFVWVRRDDVAQDGFVSDDDCRNKFFTGNARDGRHGEKTGHGVARMATGVGIVEVEIPEHATIHEGCCVRREMRRFADDAPGHGVRSGRSGQFAPDVCGIAFESTEGATKCVDQAFPRRGHRVFGHIVICETAREIRNAFKYSVHGDSSGVCAIVGYWRRFPQATGC